MQNSKIEAFQNIEKDAISGGDSSDPPGHTALTAPIHSPSSLSKKEITCCFSYNTSIENDHVECIDILYENQIPWKGNECKFAAERGRLKCLQYLHSKNFPWGPDVCAEAARNGHLKILQYLHSNGCLWDKYVYIWAARNKHFECMEYLHTIGGPWEEDDFLEWAVQYYLQTNLINSPV